jgi:two-component system, NtrC family, sensor histidine kinase HydH
MLKKAIISIGICVSLFLLWFAVYNYREAGPIAEENLRGLALSITAAIENLAVHDPSLAALAKFHTSDLAYFALVDRRGIYRFHSNPDLIGDSVKDEAFLTEFWNASRSEARVMLGTGERAFQFTAPMYLPSERLVLRLTLHTYRADAVIRRAKLNTTILLGLLVVGWLLVAALFRYARREELHQMEMARKEGLAKLGEMGAMLAHEIRNPLAGIKGFAQVIAKRPLEPRNSGFAQHIVTEAVRLENLVNELLSYAAVDGPAPTSFDLVELIDHTISLLTPETFDQHVKIVRECPDALQLSGNRDRLEQALLNLGKNALQSMPDGGVLRLTAVAVGNDAVITVADSGHGIAGKDLPKVFEPFFTTKARGTGLGLALCRKIVEEHNGTIKLASVIGQGTTVTVTLPLSKRPGVRRSRS